MAGGWVSARPGCRHLWWFAAVELAIGAFGAASIAFYHGIGRLTIELSSIATGAVTFLLVLVPTILMGATLPLLVAYAVGRTGSVGLSVGALYGANTAGSALAAILTVAVLLPQLGLHASVRVAAACNAVVAVATVIRAMRERSPAPRARPIGVREVV
jgi:predicted membrane-bound spermidine synthase